MKITMFHGASCPHCRHMMPIVDKLIEEGFEIEKKEVWNNEENAKEMRELKDIIIPACEDGLGIPAFVDAENKKALCGECSYEDLKKWLME
jgi:thiol-disulfide isomerase/thioredoxin